MNQLRQHFLLLLADRYTQSESASLWRAFVAKVKGIPENQTYFCKDSDFSNKECDELATIASQLAKGIPYQHLLGYQELGGLRFNVSGDVLIPRPETAELVQWITDDCALSPAPRILDLGTGSGYIAVALAFALPKAKVTALDFSVKALQMARSNARLHQVSIEFVEADMLGPLPFAEDAFDILVSNPPYILPDEQEDMDSSVLDYEPHQALFTLADDPLLFYRSIAKTAQKCLSRQGALYVEINQRFGCQTCELLQSMGFITTLRQDSFGNDRMIKAVPQR